MRFEALVGDAVAVSIDTTDKSLNPSVELQNSAGGVLASNDDGGPGTDSLTVFVFTSSGEYFVRVKGSTPSTTGSYQVRVDMARGIQMEADSGYSNDTVTVRTPLR